jgi:UDP-N-acetylmuramate dehydrogenase
MSRDHDAGPPDQLEAAERLLRQGCGGRVHTAFPLAPLTSFRLGGPAALYLEPQSEADLGVAAQTVGATGISWMVIGKGSNVLISDRGFEGLVIRLGKGFRWVARHGDRLQAGGSMPLPALAGVALAHSLAGLEFGVAIPASLGGAVRMNAGAHDHAMDEVLETIELYSFAHPGRSVLAAADAAFGYRRSALPEAALVVGATVRLRPGDPEAIRGEMEEARAWRRATQPLAEPNCGSVFKNPPGRRAASLVEGAGCKGLTVGGASVSTKHANFIVTRPGARAEDVHHVILQVQERVNERFGVLLEPEVQRVGDFDLASI